MTTLFGRFEIQSELSRSETALIYKAMDTKSNQVVALKTQDLAPLGDRAGLFVDALIAEGESTKDLVSQNIVVLYGAGEVEGQFCAAMEYVQGNSIATMLARNEGFSIWDLLDITRQICSGLEHAAAKDAVHWSLEPAKIMVQWDGMVKILGYGISNMSLIEAESGKGLGPLMSYLSPEQLRGEAIDVRSNLYTLGTMLYEMATGRRAFEGPDPAALVNDIENVMPAAPLSLNARIHPVMSDLIMKALAKDPAERYQTARALVEDLEKCKETNVRKAAPESKKSAAAPQAAVSSAARAAAASKFVSASAGAAAKTAPSDPAVSRKPVARPAAPARAPLPAVSPSIDSRASSGSNAAAEEDGAGSAPGLMSGFEMNDAEPQTVRGPVLSAAAEVETERPLPRVAVDPMMSEAAPSSSGKSFSDLAEMPPLKETVFVPPPPPEPAPTLNLQTASTHSRKEKEEEKPAIPVREVAAKAMHQVATIPPRLMLYAMAAAVGVILLVAIGVYFHVRSEDDGATAAPQKISNANRNDVSASAQPAAQTPTPQVAQPVAPLEEAPKLTVRAAAKRAPKNPQLAPTPAPVVVAGDALIDSTPQGAAFQVDGRSDPSWVTPFVVAGLSPGKHIVSVGKSGYNSDIRSVDVASGNRSSLMLRLVPVNALVVVNSTPAGAEIVLDGKPTGRVTPAQFSVEKGSHTVLVRKQGYLDETTMADLGPAQNFQYAPALRALGNTEDMRTIGTLGRLFGRGGQNAGSMGSIQVRTSPKGAQVAINQQILEKTSPIGVALGPGNYIVDITLTGFKPVHRVVSVDKGARAVIDEILERQ